MKGRARTAVLTLLVVAFCAYSYSVKAELRQRSREGLSFRIGDEVPDFTASDLTGEPVALADVVAANEVTVINFWATWCRPCRIEMPSLERLYGERRDDGLAILAVTHEDRATVEAFLATRSYSFPVLIDEDGAVSDAFEVRVLPTTVVLDADGEVLLVEEGLGQYMSVSIERFLDR